jgi:hypothetical protein
MLSTAQAIAKQQIEERLSKNKQRSLRIDECVEELLKMKSLILKELEVIHGYKSRYGRFNVRNKSTHKNIIALVQIDYDDTDIISTSRVAWFKSEILDNEDCYHDFHDAIRPSIRARIFNLYNSYNTWDLEEEDKYKKIGEIEEFQKIEHGELFIKEVGKHLAAWL